MKIRQTYPVLFVCLVYISLTSSKPLEPTYVDELNRALLQMSNGAYEGYLLFAIPAASAGKNFFQMPDSLSEDCIRTAKVIMQSFAKPSTAIRSLYVVFHSVTEAVKAKSNSLFQKQVNMTCKYMNEKVKDYPLDFPDFEEQKKNVELPNPVKNYIYMIPSDQNIKDWLYSVPVNMDDPEMIKYESILHFQKLKKKSSADNLDFMGTAKAVDQLSKKPAFRSIADKVFVQALEDYANDLLPQKIDKYAATHSSEFVKKVDKYFLKNPQLKNEYNKMKKNSIYEAQTPDLSSE